MFRQVGNVTSTDPDVNDPGTWSTYLWQSLTTQVFTITPDGRLLLLQPLNFVLRNYYAFQIQVVDSFGLNSVTNVTVNVLHVNHPPTLAAITQRSLDERLLVNSDITLYGTPTNVCADDVDTNDTLAFTLPTGSSFVVTTVGRCARIQSNVSFVFETMPTTYNLNLTVCDNGSPVLCTSGTVVVTINHVNQPPVLPANLNFTVSSHAVAGAAAGSPIVVADPGASLFVCVS